ncbi:MULTISPECIES: fumarylacetoacetate hydrolase family protein [unclassified Paenibacillus]|uniref:fumarylacetoacetate hydrolase family protein n=1 Tax=unclassified Paenibacillus TaxID=185978 RepID=UPI002405E66D|nr:MULTISPECIES: fumarylacetoacetate hydrolase family protein [unclassified Paenibacillus]MDF9842199.1 fumarylpyruvate hydrolase [Paenibacillus sp. PastF-2]MDF9848924.1 fumarylpyruvate hydrolase [Paenibacillus sp. PastM-2]MDF9855494.1 fumarylpyruvate hydrolase [Paenibacillus sp. PastF-1]MDH6480630.1 fumarylpyruvate hydrolase [Paenibacillus sp. PastH-2]MDH6508188.1 fumarylpyruvate hydrolase [Paenibacillus sp. PastM-3]
MCADINNVYCVGRNYRLHAEELGNKVPVEPLIFLKPSHAAVPMDKAIIHLPQNAGQIHYEGELVLRIARDYVPGMSVEELVDVMALGLDFTLRDVQEDLKKKGLPWTAAKGFKNAAPLTPYIALPEQEELEATDFTVRKNGAEVQRGNVKDMIFSLQKIVEFIAARYGLGKNDLIFTGTPAGVGPVVSGDSFELFWGERLLGTCIIG